MASENIISDLKHKKYKPVYWLEGEEPYFIDEIMNFAEHNILSESEASFNLTIFYGKETNWADVLNACKRYPMFSDRQVVLLKEAQSMKDLDKLESYIINPLASTLFFVSHKEKKIDGKTKFAKTLKAKTELLSTKKLQGNYLSDWAKGMIHSLGLNIDPKVLMLLIEHIGNDLSRIHNEIEKIAINLKGRTTISEDDIERYIGISKEFNVFEFQNAIGKRNFEKAIRINQYFAANPKAAPIQMVIPTIHKFFCNAYMVFGAGTFNENEIGSVLGIANNYFVKDYIATAKSYGQQGIESILLLLHEYNLKSIGINDKGTEDADLIKELLVKIML